ncbi:probable CCR4-associated factor 1 homolog 9 [Neltuma alba]|uniref:probable CCR4-associated factor 1 homolog 9 n=1 Tax=Neltuma alba TaxID=207710 RepID=UPI0010A3E8BB|nr:probable CCR4-associated factor 1 homolog 9 [Prosopis alba]XP_028788271.1 probable CCR4-associated factor 1 homolog 9 [Prosopis alba]
MNSNPDGKHVIVREVWASNLVSELSLIRAAMPTSCFASFDTEFPGTIITPDVDKRSYSKLSPPTNYSFMKANVDELKIIQIGLTLSDSDGNLTNFGTPNGYIWQFNFSDFDAEHDCHNVESIQLFEKQGIDFVKNKRGFRRGFSGILF